MRWALPAFIVLATGCVGPARTYPVYESRATHSAEAAQSAVQSARAGIRDAIREDAFAAYISALMVDAEETASTAEAHFASIQPPDEASDRLRADVLPLLQHATGTIERARIAARRGDASALAALDDPLSHLNDDLSAFLERHEP